MTRDDLTLALARWQQGSDFENPQRKREEADLAFYQGEGQWPEEIKIMRKGQAAVAGMPAVPARPCLTINKVKGAITHVENEFTESDLGITIIPADDINGEGPDEKEVELREGLTRRIQRDSSAQDAMTWAGKRAAICGRGFAGIMTRYVDGASFDQEVYFRRFYNQFQIVLDPAHEEPDACDIDWGFVGTDVPWNIYKVEYARTADGKKNPVLTASDDEWRAYGDRRPGWFTDDGETRSVRVVEYWYYDRELRTLVQLSTGQSAWFDELPKSLPDGITVTASRDVIQKTVKFAKLDGAGNVFEETDWPGPSIPLVKFVGEEIQPFDNERREEGMVRGSRESQQAFNYMISAAVELIGLAPKASRVGYKGQFEGLEQQWDLANTRALGRLEVNATTDDTGSQILPLPQAQSAEPPIQAMSAMMQAFDEMILSTLNLPGVRQGNVDPKIRSGRAIQQMLQQSARGTSNFMTNYIRSVHRCGDLVNELLYPIYGSRDGRIVQIMTSKHESKTVMVNKPFVLQNKKPVGFKPEDHAGMPVQHYTLTEAGAKGKTAIKVSKNYDTKNEQMAAMLGDMISQNPELMSWFGDLFLLSVSDLPEHKAMAERAKVMLAPPIQKMLAEGQPTDPQVAQLQSALQQMQQELQKLMADKGAKIESAQIKAQSDAQTTAADNATQIQKAEIAAAASMANAQAKVDAENFRSYVDALETRIAKVLDLHMQRLAAHDAGVQSVAQLGHEAVQSHLDRTHEAAIAQLQHEHAKAEISHEAAVMPTPQESNV